MALRGALCAVRNVISLVSGCFSEQSTAAGKILGYNQKKSWPSTESSLGGALKLKAQEFYFPCTMILSMLLFYHMLAGAFLPFFILSGNRVSAENINFYNVRPPLDPTPFPDSFKCFTCDNAVDNYDCNRWAEDRWCPESTQYCLTVHLFTDQGKSTSVTKKCATGEECHFVGCHRHRESGHTECISCCEGMICNVEIPTNHTNAVFAVLHARRTSDGSKWTVNIAVLVSVMMTMLL